MTGTTTSVRSVLVNNPPMTVIAIGRAQLRGITAAHAERQ